MARAADGPAIEQLHRASVRRLAVSYYSPAQIESFLAGGTLDAGLVEAGSYYVGELGDTLVGSGGWMAVRRGQAARGVPGSGRSSSIPTGRVEGSVAGW